MTARPPEAGPYPAERIEQEFGALSPHPWASEEWWSAEQAATAAERAYARECMRVERRQVAQARAHLKQIEASHALETARRAVALGKGDGQAVRLAQARYTLACEERQRALDPYENRSVELLREAHRLRRAADKLMDAEIAKLHAWARGGP